MRNKELEKEPLLTFTRKESEKQNISSKEKKQAITKQIHKMVGKFLT